ncbi:MAG: hypothetical protein BWY78_00607 [Alphaproteobacteria bacterium ADurb.Bin438]|nr:MAG: hypothetical protein BWY78_00607 [Alphaproteobacteria bacterium ADurb.Bin438]
MRKNFDAYILFQMLDGNRGTSAHPGNLKYLKTVMAENKQWHSESYMYFIDNKLGKCFKVRFKTSKRTNHMSLCHDMSKQLIECDECDDFEYNMLGY